MPVRLPDFSSSGAKHITCIEARADNLVKCLVAVYAMGWNNVKVYADDFHNAHPSKYGQFDLVFAHGVYYHSAWPFLFFDNLMAMSSSIFIGGFCATDDSPPGPSEILEYEGEKFRAKRYQETGDFTAGVNVHAFFFYAEDLMRVFERRGYEVNIISDAASNVTAGRFVRFLATKTT